MKKVIVTGREGFISSRIVDSYSGNEDYKVYSVSLRNGVDNLELKNVDTIIHLAALVHQRETQENIESYHKINYELTYELVKKAKQAGVKNFIFMSTMAVYGLEGSLKDVETISKKTPLNPLTRYAKSKLMAENSLKEFQDDKFIVKVVRPPMVYGEGAPGNFNRLLKLANYLPVFPNIKNQRSMIEINTLVDYIKLLVDSKESGLHFPQDKNYVSTTKMYVNMRNSIGKKTLTVSIPSKIVSTFPFKKRLLKKMFGNLVYDQSLKFISWEGNYEDEQWN